MKATELKSLSATGLIAKVGALFTADQKKTGVLACVSMAQFIKESSWGKSELAQKANNCFGMKTSLSGNTWTGSAWDGKSVYTRETSEYKNGKYVTVTANFRKYDSIEDSIADHSAYLLGAKKGSALRYAGLKGCTDYEKAAQIIKNGGYATSPTYVSGLCELIERYDLDQYDCVEDTSGFSSDLPYLVRVSISDLNIRKGPGTNYAKTGKYTGKGIFTIVEEANGQGSSEGWGLLKAYQEGRDGWISLGYCTKIV